MHEARSIQSDKAGDVVVMDNLGSHKGNAVRGECFLVRTSPPWSTGQGLTGKESIKSSTNAFRANLFGGPADQGREAIGTYPKETTMLLRPISLFAAAIFALTSASGPAFAEAQNLGATAQKRQMLLPAVQAARDVAKRSRNAGTSAQQNKPATRKICCTNNLKHLTLSPH
jgi:hypothetical protein